MATSGFKIEQRTTPPATTTAARALGRKTPAKGDFFAELTQARKHAPTDAAKASGKADRQSRTESKSTEPANPRVRDRQERDATTDPATDAAKPKAIEDEQNAAPIEDDSTEASQSEDDSTTDDKGDEGTNADPDAALLMQLAAASRESAAQPTDTIELSAGDALTEKSAVVVPTQANGQQDGDESGADGVPLTALDGLETGEEAVTELLPGQPKSSRSARNARESTDDHNSLEGQAKAGKADTSATLAAVADLESSATIADPSAAADPIVQQPIPDAAAAIAGAPSGPRHAQVEPRLALAPQAMPEAHFAEANHPKIVTSVSGQLQTNGGTMQIRLDPPHLGPLAVSVHMRDGVVTASFETQNDDATKLLSHSLSQLKSALEAQGLSVDKLQVQQAPKDQSAGNDSADSRQQQNQQGLRDGTEQQQQKQRQEMLRRMWQRVTGDPIDLVA